MKIKGQNPERMTNHCAVCRNEELDIFPTREMQMGTREVFEYGHCQKCGCITRLSRVTDMSRYYPPNYYSFTQRNGRSQEAYIKEWLRKRRDRILLTRGSGYFEKLIRRLSGWTPGLYEIVGKCRFKLSSSVLEVGCGSGRLLQRMAEVGFQNLTGIDMFLPENLIRTKRNLRIIRGDLGTLQGQSFDLIMMHHFFEHCDDQSAQLRLVGHLLKPHGQLLIRQPLCDSEAYLRYGRHWFQLDPPRHALLHSTKSMKLLVQECGLRTQDIIWDSTDQQFWASEQFAGDIPMYSEKSYLSNPAGSPFVPQQIAQWKCEANRLNRLGLGDQAAFYITHA